MKGYTFTGERKEDGFGGWSQNVKVGDVEYQCTVRRGKSVRIPYKPRGQNRGYKWTGNVYRVGGGFQWSDTVSGSIGCKGLLEEAGVFGEAFCPCNP